MFPTLIRREFLANLMTFRFLAAMLVCLLLVVSNTFVLIDDYKQRLADYNMVMSKPRAEAVTPTWSIRPTHTWSSFTSTVPRIP